MRISFVSMQRIRVCYCTSAGQRTAGLSSGISPLAEQHFPTHWGSLGCSAVGLML